jgi:hypothetical protein
VGLKENLDRTGGSMSRYEIETLAVIVGLLAAFAVSWYADGAWWPSIDRLVNGNLRLG